MNRLLIYASKSAASSLRTNQIASSSATARFLAARHLSDATAGASDDAETKVGFVKYFSYQNKFGFIVPDGVDPTKHRNDEICFIHRNDIKVMDDAADKFYPGLRKGMRVQFKVGPPDEGKESKRAYDLTMEGGDFVPLFQPGYLKAYIRSQKARFGDEVFDIFSNCTDQNELETKIVEAFDRVKANIERQTEKVSAGEQLMNTDDEGEKNR
eukprot:CAMPEP_0183749802 /NCGR_PEP_ID=MMETSP0739-20130205/501_1 /TAXON_ID=385413 /ORGANISM="Thalassiosira miniscula, Strain CCMP1093" /LENGTH=211 /DNA_ID=CAMNT_0025985651 /DNA_START=19 /DNA_END=654 /DNA_ORIENTATION=-